MSNIKTIVEKFVSDLEHEFRRQTLASIQDALGKVGGQLGAFAPATPTLGAAKPRKTASKAKPVKVKTVGGAKPNRRTPAEIEATTHKVLTYIKNHPNSRSEDIKKALGLDKATWLLPIARLIQTKQVVMKGQKRAATYAAK